MCIRRGSPRTCRRCIHRITRPPVLPCTQMRQCQSIPSKLAGRGANVCATAAGLLLFGKSLNRRLPQAGVTAVAFPGTGKDYNTIDEERIRGPLISLVSDRGYALEKGVIDRSGRFRQAEHGPCRMARRRPTPCGDGPSTREWQALIAEEHQNTRCTRRSATATPLERSALKWLHCRIRCSRPFCTCPIRPRAGSQAQRTPESWC